MNAIQQTLIRWITQHPRLALFGLTAAALFLILWFVTRPGARFGPKDVTWHRVQVNRDLYVGLDPNYPPFAEWTPEQIEGLEADIAREIGRRLDVKTSILIMGTDGLYDALYTGTVDMLISGLHVNPGYEEWVYYSQPYFDAGQILVSPANQPIEDIRELDGKTVAVELASAGDIEAHRWARRLHHLQVRRYLLPQEAMQAVQTGEVNAALVDTISARLYLKEHPDLVMAPETTYPDEYVIAMRKQNFQLQKAVEDALSDMIADGTLDEIITRWL